jgi:cytosine/adenosine deaminase-related metal-dependent hydrolase
MPPPPTTPRNFPDILRLIWWRLDCALDMESIEISARIGALSALACGTTTLIDHHASPNCIADSLDAVERGVDAVGSRAILCYETTDRHGPRGSEQGLAENRRYLSKCRSRAGGKFAGLVGAHASFTLDDRSLSAVATLANEFDVGVHIHVAEDPCDEEACRRDHGIWLIDRLADHGLVNPRRIFAHGTHLNENAIAKINRAGTSIAHNPRSNMNNSVGYTPIARMECPLMLGTDGIGADLFAEAQSAWLKSRDARSGLTLSRIIEMLANNARRASLSLGVTLGQLKPGAAADVIVSDYIPFTPLTIENAAAHLLYGMTARHVRDIFVAGQRLMHDRQITNHDPVASCRLASEIAAGLWRRMEALFT